MAVSAPTVRAALERLLDARMHSSAMSLSLAILALTAHGADLVDLPKRLVVRQDADGGFRGRCDFTALAACALGAVLDGTHAFKV
jgi:hypothetical protein